MLVGKTVAWVLETMRSRYLWGIWGVLARWVWTLCFQVEYNLILKYKRVQSYDYNRKIDEGVRGKEQNKEKIIPNQSPGSIRT